MLNVVWVFYIFNHRDACFVINRIELLHHDDINIFSSYSESGRYVVGACTILLYFNILSQQNATQVFLKPTQPPKTSKLCFAWRYEYILLSLHNSFCNPNICGISDNTVSKFTNERLLLFYSTLGKMWHNTGFLSPFFFQ